MMITRGRRRQSRDLGRGRRLWRRGFTLVEVLMAMMVSGVILSAAVGLAWALATYNNEGEAAKELATHARFAVAYLGRDVRAARVVAVTSAGGVVLWLGDLDGNGQMDTDEFVVHYRPAGDRVMRRISFANGVTIGDISPATAGLVVSLFDTGMLVSMADASGAGPCNDVICRNVDGLSFYPNRAAPETMTVEYVLALSCGADIVDGSGRTIALNVYGSGTMRAPYEGDGFEPQH